MKIVTMDFTGVEYIGQVHLILTEALDFPEWYGKNLDALWDLLTGYIEPCIINIKGLREVSKELTQYMQKVVNILLEAEKTYNRIQINFIDEPKNYF